VFINEYDTNVSMVRVCRGKQVRLCITRAHMLSSLIF